MSKTYFDVQRQQMVAAIRNDISHVSALIGKTMLDDRVLRAMSKVLRHEFVPSDVQPFAYANVPLPIGFGKTISQPFIVAVMTDLLEVQPADTILEIGTGLGYQAAILAELGATVSSVEMVAELAKLAKQRLKSIGYDTIKLRVGNGYHGWPEHAPFDKIIVTAAPDLIPPPLIYQLKPGGRMVLPVGLPDAQHLVVVEKNASGRVTTKDTLLVRFSLLDGSDEVTARVS